MSYLVLARKWRPKTFTEVLGQTHITRSLLHSIQRKKLGHAYLLTGTRGVGKTSIARIFAKALKCENPNDDGNPCTVCDACLSIDQGNSIDVLEMDGASNNKVEHVRSLVETVQFLPSQGQYKVYIIDEVHMLTDSAFNALLKTLEEPPAHVVFIFATTEPDRVLSTILSRCQRFDCRQVTLDTLCKHLKNIAATDGISFENDHVITQICEQGQGSVRDTLSTLDQVLSFSIDNNVTEEVLMISLGLAKSDALKKLVSFIFSGEVQEVSKLYRSLLEENINLKNLGKSILNHLFEIIQVIDDEEALVKKGLVDISVIRGVDLSELFWIFETLSKDILWSLDSLIPVKTFELVLQKTTLRKDFFGNSESVLRSGKLVAQGPKDAHKEKVEKAIAIEPTTLVEESHREANKVLTWDTFLAFARNESAIMASNLEQGNITEELVYNDDFVNVKLGFKDSGRIFYEYLSENESNVRIKKLLAKYFKVLEEKVNLELALISSNNRKESFRSVMENKEDEKKKLLDERRENIKNADVIKHAEDLFSTQIDKVILNDE